MVRNFNSPEAQSEILINAIENNDTQKLSTLLSSQNNSVDENEATAYIKYIKKEVGMKQFVKDVNSKITKLNKSSTKEAGFVTAKMVRRYCELVKWTPLFLVRQYELYCTNERGNC